MNLPDLIFSHAKALPTDLQKETLDFIGYLEMRYQTSAAASGQLETEAFLARLVGSIGSDFPDDIDEQDLALDVARDSLP